MDAGGVLRQFASRLALYDFRLSSRASPAPTPAAISIPATFTGMDDVRLCGIRLPARLDNRAPSPASANLSKYRFIASLLYSSRIGRLCRIRTTSRPLLIDGKSDAIRT